MNTNNPAHTVRRPRRLEGRVVRDAMQKTVVVEVMRQHMHAKLKRYYTKSSRHKAHDPENAYHTGDTVVIEETRPLSKEKRWRVVEKM